MFWLDQMEDWSLIAEPSAVPVTALLNLGDVLLSGEGSFLHLYCFTNSKKHYIKIFTSANIHGIVKNSTTTNVHQLCIFGGRFYRLLTLNMNFKVVEMSPEMQVTYWISDCSWVSYRSKWSSCCSGFVLYCSNNTLTLHDLSSLQIVGTVGCQESCILYSAKVLFQPEWSGVVAIGGTVFNQIVVWSTEMTSFLQEAPELRPALHRITGHMGVISGLDWNAERKELCSVSDDRSIRIHKMDLQGDVLDFESWRKCEFKPGLVLFGHTARVWRAKLLEQVIVSIAEDATCAVWSYEGRMLQKFIGHRGKNIFSLEVNKSRSEIYTGGSDGSIRMWKLASHSDVQSSSHFDVQSSSHSDLQLTLDPPMEQDKDFPRSIRLVGGSKLLVMTNMGSLLMFEVESRSWVTLMSNPKYSSYCLLETNDNTVAVANIHGWILLLQIKDSSARILLEKQIFDGKVLSIHWLTKKEFLTTGPDGHVVVWKLEVDRVSASLSAVSKYLLPLASQRWVSAASILEGFDVLVCGDRVGSIHVYKFPASDRVFSKPVKSFNKVFGIYGVTCVRNQGDRAFCCGRNGQIHVYKGTSAETFDVVHAFNAYKGFDWLSRIVSTDDGQCIIGFLADKFVMFDVPTNRFLIAISCGGGHRTWDFEIDKTRSIFVFIKKRQIILHQNSFRIQKPLIKPSQQGLGITSILQLGSSSPSNGFVDTFVTAGEDGLLNFASVFSSNVSNDAPCMKEHLSDVKVMTMKGHASGLKAMSAVMTSPDSSSGDVLKGSKSSLLFTAGAGGVIKAWELRILEDFSDFPSCEISNDETETGIDDRGLKNHVEVHNFQDGVLLKQLCEHTLSNKYKKGCKPWRHFEVNEMLETRYMTLDVLSLPESFEGRTSNARHRVLVFAGCSLGFVRIFMFDRRTKSLEVLKEFDFHEHCVLKVKHHFQKHRVTRREKLWLLSAATDGRVAFWDVADDVSNFLQNASESSFSSKPSFDFQCHQSGINGLDLLGLEDDDRLLLCTGGDDNSVVVTLCDVTSCSVVNQGKHETAHSSQVSGVKFIREDLLLSASIDQRLVLWKIGGDLQMTMMRSIFLDVSDISDMTVISYPEKKSYGVFVVGRGLQRIHLKQAADNCSKESILVEDFYKNVLFQ